MPKIGWQEIVIILLVIWAIYHTIYGNGSRQKNTKTGRAKKRVICLIFLQAEK